MNVDGSDVRRVTRRVGYDGGPSSRRTAACWSGGRCTRTRPDSADYLRLLESGWCARRDSSSGWHGRRQRARQVTRLGADSFRRISPDGRRIIFASNQPNPRSRNFDLYLVNLDGSGLEQVTTSPEFDAFPMFSPDGKRLVFASNRNAGTPGETNIFIADWVE